MSEATPKPALTPDVAAKVLQADLRTTVTKVAAGERLPPADRARFETAALTAPSAEELAQLKANRQASLIRKWSGGGKLDREEMSEIHTILPPAIIAAPPLPAPPSPGARVKHAKTLAEYAPEIGVSERTLKRWNSHGKKVGELFPFDNLALALDWWTRHMKNSPPADLVNAVAQAKRAAEKPTSLDSTGPEPSAKLPAAPASPAIPLAQAAPLLSASDMTGGSLEDNLRRVSAIHAGNLALLERAFLGTNEAEITGRQRNAKLSGEMLQSAQKALDDFRRERGDVVPIADVKTEGIRIHSAMAQSLLGMVIDLGITRERAVPMVDAWFRMLRESRFYAETVPAIT
jgi:hypothetical protein